MAHARGDVPGLALDQAVAVEGEQAAGRQQGLAGFEGRSGHPQGRVRGHGQEGDGAVGVGDRGGRLAGARVRQKPGHRVVDAVQAGREGIGAQLADDVVEVVEDLVGWQLQLREGADGRAEPAHGGGLGHAVAHDVADHERHPGRGERDHVVPVAADVGSLFGRLVARRGRHLGQLGQCLRQQTALEGAGPGRRLVVEPGPFQGLCDESAERGQQRSFVIVQHPRPAEGDHRGADPAPGDSQGEKGPRLLAVLPYQDFRCRVTLQELLRRGDAEGGAGSQGVPHRVRGVPHGPLAVQQPGEAFRVSPGADHGQPVADGTEHDESGGPQGCHHAVGHRRHHVLGRDGLRQLPCDPLHQGRPLLGRPLRGCALGLAQMPLGGVGDVEREAFRYRHQPQVVPERPVRPRYVESGRPALGRRGPAAFLQPRYGTYRGKVPEHCSGDIPRGAQEPLGGLVEESDAPVRVQGDEAVAHVPQGPPHRLGGGVRLAAVPEGADHLDRRPLLVRDRPGTGLDPEVRAVLAPYAVLVLEAAAQLDARVETGYRPRQVVRVDQLRPRFDAAGHHRGIDAGQHLLDGPVGGQLAGAQVPGVREGGHPFHVPRGCGLARPRTVLQGAQQGGGRVEDPGRPEPAGHPGRHLVQERALRGPGLVTPGEEDGQRAAAPAAARNGDGQVTHPGGQPGRPQGGGVPAGHRVGRGQVGLPGDGVVAGGRAGRRRAPCRDDQPGPGHRLRQAAVGDQVEDAAHATAGEMHHAAQTLHLGHGLLERGQQHLDIVPVLVHGVEQPHPHAVAFQGAQGLYGPQSSRLVQRTGSGGRGRADVMRIASSGVHHGRLSPPLIARLFTGLDVIAYGPCDPYRSNTS